ncbi:MULTISPECIES: hypothetical protein [Acinetobacter]|uniref:Condensation domain-containing protein n=4 Tax=Acinetobacter TaxID=469 RepID=A0A6L9E5X3_ACIHA|nr:MULTISPECIES: hypothetical protein [Acinetobacter]EJB8578619.1 hypothetical protein [Acinetobacter baumannii]MCU4613590.1 hypothetical protein [Acinetobacter parvus]NAR51524.1 hypothetical protein [Acinetobacter haemolyticus]NAR57022.1 hypothetical protein [Acinetobacter haemolyticus]NAR61953.1 hypothetical protein [Acinetobacter haemolyticus]
MYITLNSTQRKFSSPKFINNKFSKGNISVCFEIKKKLDYENLKLRLKKILIENPILKSKYCTNKNIFQYGAKNKTYNLSYLENIEISLFLKKIEKTAFKIDKPYHFKIFYINNVEKSESYIFICISHNICDGLSLMYLFKSLLDDEHYTEIATKTKKIDQLESKVIDSKYFSYDEDGVVDKYEVATKNIFHNSYVNYNINKFLDASILALFNASKKYLDNFVVKELFKFNDLYRINNELDFYLYSLEGEKLSENSISEKRKLAKKNHTPYWDLVQRVKPMAYNGYYGVANIEINYRARYKGVNSFKNISYVIHFNEEALHFAEADISLIIDQMSERKVYYKFLFNRKKISQDIQALILENFSNYINNIQTEENKFSSEVITCCII